MVDELSNLVASLESQTPAERQAAAERLVRLGRDARPAAVALVQACQLDDQETRELAAAALEDLGPPLPQDVAQIGRAAQASVARRRLLGRHVAGPVASPGGAGRFKSERCARHASRACRSPAHRVGIGRSRSCGRLGRRGPAAGGRRRGSSTCHAGRPGSPKPRHLRVASSRQTGSSPAPHAARTQTGQLPGCGEFLLAAISGYGDAGHKPQSLDAAINPHLLKPVEFATIQQILSKHLR